ncbi:MAG: hypothetical protein AB8B80_04465 [Marinicellaceae bacterium]
MNFVRKLIPISLVFTSVSVISKEHNLNQPASASVNAPTQSAKVVWLDPESGKIVSKKPTGATDSLRLSNSESNALNRSDEGLVPQIMPDGHVKVDLQGRYRHMSTVTLDSNGKQKHSCNTKVTEHKHGHKGETQ